MSKLAPRLFTTPSQQHRVSLSKSVPRRKSDSRVSRHTPDEPLFLQLPRLCRIRQGQDQQLRCPCSWYVPRRRALLYNSRGAGYTQTLRPGVKASFGLALDTQRLNDVAPSGPAHKVGASISFDA